MPEIEVVWTGFDALLERYEKIEGGAAERIDKTMANIGSDSLSVMNGYTPVDTGWLKGNNKMEPIEHGFVLSNETPYAIFVEYGTRKMAAQPYLGPAVEYAMKSMEQQLPDALELDE